MGEVLIQFPKKIPGLNFRINGKEIVDVMQSPDALDTLKDAYNNYKDRSYFSMVKNIAKAAYNHSGVRKIISDATQLTVLLKIIFTQIF